MKKALVGTRIREQRRSKGMTQAALAGLSEISPSYLNLIEHNKRSVAGRVLISIAKALEVSPSDLTEGIESQVLSELQEAAASQPDVKPETDSIEELIGRFPGWSRLVANLFRQIRDQDKTIEALSDRLTHDPFLGENMHAMLTNVTAIGSTASILNSIEDMPDLRRQRFLRNIEDDATRLSEAVRELTAYFDHSADREPGAATPEEELDHWLARNAYHFPLLDELPVAEEMQMHVIRQASAMVPKYSCSDSR